MRTPPRARPAPVELGRTARRPHDAPAGLLDADASAPRWDCAPEAAPAR